MLGEQFHGTFHTSDDGTVSNHDNPDLPTPASRQGMLFSPHTGTGTKHDPLVSRDQRVAAIESGYGLDKDTFAHNHRAETGKKAGARKMETDRKMAIDSIYESGIPVHGMAREGNPDVVVSDTSKSRGNARGHYSPRNDRAWTQVEKRTSWSTETLNVPVAGDGNWIRNPKPMNFEDHRAVGFGDWEEGDPTGETPPTPPSSDQLAEDKASLQKWEARREAHSRFLGEVDAAVPEGGDSWRREDEKERVVRDLKFGDRTDIEIPSGMEDESPYNLVRPTDRAVPRPFTNQQRYERDSRELENRQESRSKLSGVDGRAEDYLYSKPAPATNEKVYSELIGTGFKYTPLKASIDENTEYWGRQNATAWEQQDVQVKKTSRSAPERTMVHEIGHGVHMDGDVDPTSNREYNRAADPLEEGVADAYADKYSRYSEAHSTRANPADSRRSDDLTMSGYGSDSDRWSNDTERALYRATRHTTTVSGDIPSPRAKTEAIQEATGGSGYRDMDESHLDYINRGNTMALGRLMSENPDARNAFSMPEGVDDPHIARMANAATKAQAHYEDALNQRKLRAAGNPVEQELPF